MFNRKFRNDKTNKSIIKRVGERRKDLKKRRKRRSIDSRLTREKSSFNLRAISAETTDSAEIIAVRIKGI